LSFAVKVGTDFRFEIGIAAWPVRPPCAIYSLLKAWHDARAAKRKSTPWKNQRRSAGRAVKRGTCPVSNLMILKTLNHQNILLNDYFFHLYILL
jgi:hypothetical protein